MTTRPPIPHRYDAEDVTWMAYAACAGHPPIWWDTDAHDEWHTGRRICHGCPVRGQCRAYVLSFESGPSTGRWGVWAGMTPNQRADTSRDSYRDAFAHCETCGNRMSHDRNRPVRVRKQVTDTACMSCWRAIRDVKPRAKRGRERGPRGPEFTDQEAREAHNRWNAGAKDAVTRRGERRYQRDAARVYRAAQKQRAEGVS